MRQLMIALLAAALAAVMPGTAAADRAYHTKRLQLTAVGGAPGGGTVVNIHTDGPQLYAHELYTLIDAVPGTYQVFVNLSPTSLDCTGPTFTVPTAMITTNPSGNGEADATFTPEDVAAFRGMTFSLSWTVTGPATYVSGCTVTVLD
jgi:hypothetical protein